MSRYGRTRSVLACLGAVAASGTIACHERPTEASGRPPASITVVSGRDQSASVGTELPTTLVFLVADSASRPVPGVAVAFEAAYGGGTIALASTVTDARGIASPGSWRLGPAPGLNVLVASVGGFNITAQISAVAITTPVALTIDSDSILYAGTLHQRSLVVDSTALVAVIRSGKAYLYYAGLGGSPTMLSDSVSALSLSRRIAAINSMFDSDAAPSLRNAALPTQRVAGVDISTSDGSLYSFQNTQNRIAALKFSGSQDAVILAPQSLQAWLSETLYPRSDVQQGQYSRGFTTPARCEVFGSVVAPLVFLGPVGLVALWTLHGDEVNAAMQSDPALFIRINAYDARLIAYQAIFDLVGLLPCGGLLTPEASAAVEGEFLREIGAHQDEDTYRTATVHMVLGTAQSAVLCACSFTPAEPVCEAVDVVLTAFEQALNAVSAARVALVSPYGQTELAPDPAPATQLTFSVQPTTTPVGASITPAVQVTAQDAQGNTAPGFTGSVTVAIGTNPGSGTLSGTTTVAAVGGVATFGNLSINHPGTGYTLTATASGLTGATSAAFTINSPPPGGLTFSVQPTTTTAGATITPAVQVAAHDAQGNPATGFTGSVTVAIGTNPSGGTLSGTTTVAAVAGVATFGNLSINTAGTGYTLTAAAGALTGATSAVFSITTALAPSIDGIISPREWDGAQTFGPFTVTLPGGALTSATFLLKNTATNLYAALQFAQDLSTYSAVIFDLRLDENVDGQWDLADGNGEDGFAAQQRVGGVRRDRYFDTFFSCNPPPPFPCGGQGDTEWGGTNDGVMASTDGATPTVIEIAHGINTSDPRDAALTPGQLVSFNFLINIGVAPDSLVTTWFPGPNYTHWSNYTVQ